MRPHCRIALYSHDTVGFGHTRRNLLIAHSLVRYMADVLLIAGAPESTAFSIPPGADCLALPALRKGPDGKYRPRRLGLGIDELISLRANTIAAALEAFKPDALIVDKVPRGAMGELEPALEALHRRGGTRCILGLRDVLDETQSVVREWKDARNDEAISRYYDSVWVYGDPTVFDPVREYGFCEDVASKVRYSGFLDQSRWLEFDPQGNDDGLAGLLSPEGRVALCLLGGGEDGAPLAEAFAQVDFPPDMSGVILTGPMMPATDRSRIIRYSESRPRLRVIEFLHQPIPLLKRADRVVAMGGYNTIGEVLSFEKTALIVPRVRPRTEQLIRAERMKELGLLDLLRPSELSPRALTEWLGRDLPPPRVRDRIDLDGLGRIPGLLEEVLPPAGRIAAREAFRPLAVLHGAAVAAMGRVFSDMEASSFLMGLQEEVMRLVV